MPKDSQRKKEASARQEQEMRGILAHNPDVIARIGPDLRHIFINQAVELFSGQPAEFFIGKTLEEAGVPEPISRLLTENIRKVFAAAQNVSMEAVRDSPSGLRHYHTMFVPEMASDGSGAVESVLVITRDVTEFKRIEHELRESDARFQAFMDNSPAVAYLKDAEGRYIYINKLFCQRFPVAAANWLGKTIADLAPPEFAIPAQLNDQKVLTTGRTVSTVEKYVHENGEVSYWQAYKFPVQTAGDKPSIGGMSLEITGQKKAEHEREKLLDEVREANQQLMALNAEKNAFLGICSHDLKNPLSGIIGMAGLIKEAVGEEGEVAGCANDILASAEFMFALVNNLLNVAAIEEGRFPIDPEALDLRTLAAHVLGRYRSAAAKKSIALSGPDLPNASPEDERFVIQADRNATLQVLDNLISNAVKYTPIGGQVSVRLTSSPEAQRATVAVSDSGPGLSPDEQGQLFQKFTRLSSRPTGGEYSTGLGLSIVKRLMTAMGGDVRCESQRGRGATFLAEFAAERMKDEG